MAYAPEVFEGKLVLTDEICAWDHTAIEDYIEAWTADHNNFPYPVTVSVSPAFDGVNDKTILIGGKKLTDQDWEDL